MYGIGFLPMPFIMLITMGIETAAVAVLLVISESRTVSVTITSTVRKPPSRFVFETASPIA